MYVYLYDNCFLFYPLNPLHVGHIACVDPEGDRGSGPPLKNHKLIGFLSNTDLDPLKITKLLGQNSMLGHHRHASETPFKWHFAGGPIMSRLLRYLDPHPLIQYKKNKQKNPSKLDPLTKLSGSARVLVPYTSPWFHPINLHLMQESNF